MESIHPLLREPNDDLIYLASPYSHKSQHVIHTRYTAAKRAARLLTDAGHIIFSPIVHSHRIDAFGGNGTWQQWQRIDRKYIQKCDSLFVLVMDGTNESTGVNAEIAYASELGIPVNFCAVTELPDGLVYMTPVLPNESGGYDDILS